MVSPSQNGIRCLTPHIMEQGGYRFAVACSKCRYCRIRRKLAWVGRMVLERKDSSWTSFWTLTYRDPPDSLPYSDVQDWLKRYRRKYGEVRFFVCGEYGELKCRPHWHCILFGGRQELEVRADHEDPTWTAGRVVYGPCEESAIRYVSGYVLKPPPRKDLKPMIRMSLRPGIGLNALYRMGAEAALRVGSTRVARFNSFFVDRTRYPLYGGGRRAFEAGFLEAGGSFENFNPELADAELRLLYDDLGSLLTDAETARDDWFRDKDSPVGADRYIGFNSRGPRDV